MWKYQASTSTYYCCHRALSGLAIYGFTYDKTCNFYYLSYIVIISCRDCGPDKAVCPGDLRPLSGGVRPRCPYEHRTLPSPSITLIARTSIIGKSIIVTHRQACLFNLTECKLVDLALEVLLSVLNLEQTAREKWIVSMGALKMLDVKNGG